MSIFNFRDIPTKFTQLAQEIMSGKYPIGNMYLDVDALPHISPQPQPLTQTSLASRTHRRSDPDDLDAITSQNTDVNYRKPSNHLWRKAVLGHSESQYQVGLWYLHGTAPLTKDLDQAQIWFRKASTKGHLLALGQLSNIVLPKRRL